jgi:3-deoxy-D-manno-octulosonate 8-phosphate phosphatase (KDO 8-P phosphatase)
MDAPANEPDPRQLAGVRLFVLDVDGVLTDGRVWYVGEEEIQGFSVHDGQGLVWLKRAGVQVAWISGRGSPATERRAAELGIVELHLRSGPKGEVLRAVQGRLEITPAQTAAMGDDLPDLALFAHAGFCAAPANARPEVKRRAHYVATASGGAGAVREVAELILRAQGAWHSLLESGDPRGA